MGTALSIEPMRPNDWPAVRSIYMKASPRETRPSSNPRRIGKMGRGSFAIGQTRRRARRAVTCWDGPLSSAVSGRCVYAGVAEISVYVAELARGRGVGRQLLAAPDRRFRSHMASGRCRPASSQRMPQVLPARTRRIPHRGKARAARPNERAMARCGVDGAQKRGGRPGITASCY